MKDSIRSTNRMEHPLTPQRQDKLIAQAEARLRVSMTQVQLIEVALRRAQERVWMARLRLEQMKARKAMEMPSGENTMATDEAQPL